MPIDYSKYSLEDLYSARSGIDKEKYPENYEALVRTIADKEAAAPAAVADPASPRIASAWLRLGAMLLDALIWLLPAFMIFGAAARSYPLAVAYFAVTPFLYTAYQVFFHARYGATPGKMAAGIRVVRDDYSRIGWRTAFKRSAPDIVMQAAMTLAALNVLAALRPYFPFEGWMALALNMKAADWFFETVQTLQSFWVWSEVVTCLMNKRRKAIHDWIAGTVVVEAPARPRAEERA